MKDILIRAGKTFIQGFLGYISIKIVTLDINSVSAIKALVIGALSAGYSAEMNLILTVIRSEQEKKKISIVENKND